MFQFNVLLRRRLCGQCGKLIHRDCGKMTAWLLAVWIVWKSSPQGLWTSAWLDDSYVDSVENLSTAIVDKPGWIIDSVDSVDNLSTANVDKPGRIVDSVDSVDNLSTANVENILSARSGSRSLESNEREDLVSPYPLPEVMEVKKRNKRVNRQKLSTENVDNSVNKCAEVMKMYQTESTCSEKRTPIFASNL